MAPDHVGHLVSDHEGRLVPVLVAQLHQRLRHEDESARKGEGRRMILRDRGHPEAVQPVAHRPRQLLPDSVEERLDLRVRIARRSFANDRRHVPSDFMLGPDGVGLAPRQRLPHPLRLADRAADHPAESVEDAFCHDNDCIVLPAVQRDARGNAPNDLGMRASLETRASLIEW
jgi:hypothetical protein